MALRDEQIVVGQIVTVASPRKWERVIDGGFMGTATVVTQQDNSWVGDLLRIEAVSLPLLALRHLRMGLLISLNVNEWDLVVPSKPYQQVMQEKTKQELR